MQKLHDLKGKEFEKAYVENEVAYHKAVINATKTVLVPSAQNAELKSALQGAEPLFAGHLLHAERVQSTIEGGVKTASSGKYGEHICTEDAIGSVLPQPGNQCTQDSQPCKARNGTQPDGWTRAAKLFWSAWRRGSSTASVKGAFLSSGSCHGRGVAA